MSQSNATLFNGESATGTRVNSSLDSNHILVINLGETPQRFEINQIKLHYPVSRGAIRARLSNDMLLEFDQGTEIERALISIRPAPLSILSLTEGNLLAISGLLLTVIGVSVAIYLLAIPIITSIVSPLIPNSVMDTVGDAAIKIFAEVGSKVADDDPRTLELQSSFQSLVGESEGRQYRLNLLKLQLNGEEISNAFAIPSNNIFITTKLWEELPALEREAILAHEFGHLKLGHGRSKLVKGATLTVLTTLILGPDPGILASLGSFLIETNYSREDERDADQFAVALLKRQGRDPRALSRALITMSKRDTEGAHRYMSTHPLTTERVREIESNADRSYSD